MSDDEKRDWWSPDPTTYTVKLTLKIDDRKAVRVIQNEVKDKIAGEFSLEHRAVKVTELLIRPQQGRVYIKVRYGPLTTKESFDEIEERIEDMLVRELGHKREPTKASIIDTLP